MNARTRPIIDRLRSERIISISQAELDVLLADTELVRMESVGFRRVIRSLLWTDSRVSLKPQPSKKSPERFHLVQEVSNRNEILVRCVATNEEAEAFIQDRLAAYDRMWDG